jgi:hypothetical protein
MPGVVKLPEYGILTKYLPGFASENIEMNA